MLNLYKQKVMQLLIGDAKPSQTYRLYGEFSTHNDIVRS